MKALYKPYDVFISYVVEDRELVEHLYSELTALGLRVWYANRELYPGAQIRAVVNRGLKSSRYGIAVITPSYRGHWALGELFILMRDREVLIPVLHRITLDEVARDHPEIITRFCLDTESGVKNTALQIANYVGVRSSFVSFLTNTLTGIKRRTRALALGLFGIAALLAIALGLYAFANKYPDKALVKAQIEKRIGNMESSVQHEIQNAIVQNDASQSSLSEVLQAQAAYIGNTPYYRNHFDYFNGIAHITTVAGLKNNNIFEREEKPTVPFGLTQYNAYLFGENGSGFGYAFVSLLPLYHEITETRGKDNLYEVDVHYTNFLRYAAAKVYVDTLKDLRTTNYKLLGTKPLETFVFEKRGDTWHLSSVR